MDSNIYQSTSVGVLRPSIANTRRSIFSLSGALFFFCGVLLIVGWVFPTEVYLTPETGLGYALGIAGGSLMLLLLLYPLRKRVHGLSFLGSVKTWFQIHMFMGLIGPICILYHSNYKLGAVNSNVALFSMLMVSGSGLIGRYFYTRIHHGLTERATTLDELQGRAVELKDSVQSMPFMPELLQRLVLEERNLLQKVSACPFILSPIYGFFISIAAKLRLADYSKYALRLASKASPVSASERRRLLKASDKYVRQRIDATREVSEFRAYTRLFSWWHIFHLPLFFMLLIAGIVHVISVHVY